MAENVILIFLALLVLGSGMAGIALLTLLAAFVSKKSGNRCYLLQRAKNAGIIAGGLLFAALCLAIWLRTLPSPGVC